MRLLTLATTFSLALLLAGCASTRTKTEPPAVTAKAWAIADGHTGKFLWGLNADEPRKSASTTKMMCALVILQLAEKNPSVLDESVTFSKLAGTTVGSTAAIKPGERVTVRDCLFGLLLPSGNDAGNALAEHFNSRFAPPDAAMVAFGLGGTNLSTRSNFIAEMNRTARRLGLTNTKYRSSFGDGGTEQDRTTTARDLTRLAWHAMQLPSFRHYVGTQHHEGKVRQVDGTSRTAAWTNTNQLLGQDGFDGVKTGTTIQAGNCLVASGHRGSAHLISAVLGAKADNDRYTDTQALFDWAWSEIGVKKR